VLNKFFLKGGLSLWQQKRKRKRKQPRKKRKKRKEDK
jgi:hypothetical protein